MRNGRRSDIFVDMCTQRDYLAADGVHPSLNAPEVCTHLRRLMALARWAHIPVLSCVDVRRPEEARGLMRPECVVGTPGQRKLGISLLPDRVLIESDNCLCVSLDALTEHQQAILPKVHRDPFTNPKLDRLLTEIPGRRFIVFGVSLETSIRLLALGLLLRHRRVAVVHDACGWWSEEEADMTLRQLSAKGCELLATAQLVDVSVAQYRPQRTNGQAHRSVA